MAEAKNPPRRLRSENTHFLGLKEEDTLPPGGLPTNKNVLEARLVKQKASNKNTPVEKLVCCSLTKTFDTKCGVFGGCDPTSRCTVGQILERYSQAGIPSLKADKLKTSCITLFKFYRDDIKKHASRENPSEKVLEKRNAFVEKLGTLFKAFPDNVEDKIKADRKQTEKDIADDLAFFADQKLDWPHCVSHARFMQRGINYITLQLLGHQADYMNYSECEQQEVELMAEYTTSYYAPRFLQSSLPAEAPIMDLRNIRDIRELRDMAREEINKDPDNRTMRLRQEAAQKNLYNI